MKTQRTRILCVNCNICVNTLRRYRILDQNIRLCSLLCIWVYPQIITEDDYVCEACWELAIAAVNDNMQQNISSSSDQAAGPSQRGHIHVCLLCGCSIARRQSDIIIRENPTELQHNMMNVIQGRIEPQQLQLTPSDRVCHVCWLIILLVDNTFPFPRLEYRDLILFALGTYQIRQARSYYGEHIRFHGGYRIEVCYVHNLNVSENNLRGNAPTTLIRGKIKSRYVSRKQYYVYILIENNNLSRENTKNSHIGYIIQRNKRIYIRRLTAYTKVFTNQIIYLNNINFNFSTVHYYLPLATCIICNTFRYMLRT